jgi:hypothetical protein
VLWDPWMVLAYGHGMPVPRRTADATARGAQARVAHTQAKQFPVLRVRPRTGQSWGSGKREGQWEGPAAEGLRVGLAEHPAKAAGQLVRGRHACTHSRGHKGQEELVRCVAELRRPVASPYDTMLICRHDQLALEALADTSACML